MEFFKFLKEMKEWAPLALLAGVFVYGFVKTLIKNFFQPKHPTIVSDIKFSLPIYDTLASLLHIIQITRSFVMQFHNGSEYYSGQKIQRLTMSHEKCLPDIHSMKTDHDGILIPGYIHGILDDMEKRRDDWFSCNIKEIKEDYPDLYQVMREYGIVTMLFFKLTDKQNGAPLGIMGLTFNHQFRLLLDGDTADDNDILRLRPYKKDIEHEFNKL